ncbi:MAG: HXXEE domain-containing protein [Methylovirgula sp.]
MQKELPDGMERWLGKHWVTGAGFMAAGFICLIPLLAKLLPVTLLLIYLHTPGYMIHQVEEHAGDRFRHFVNDRVFGGLDVLRTIDVLIINLPLVWGMNLAALYAAFAFGAGYGLVAPYAMLVNALTHFGAAIRFRSYNPGVVTSAVVFIPLSIVTIVLVSTWASASLAQHAIGLGLALLIHLLIAAQAAWRFALLRRKTPN